jgi:hypothetical protein
VSDNPLAALHPNQYRSMYLLALEREKGVPQALLEIVLQDAANRGKLASSAAQAAIDEVWQNRRPSLYYENLWKLAKRRDQGRTMEEALDACKGELHYQEWRAMIELVWGGTNQVGVKRILPIEGFRP